MAKTELLQVRIDAEVKKEASEILEALGSNLSASINMYLKQVIIHKGIPFDVRIPTEEELLQEKNQPVIEEVAPHFEEMPLVEDEPVVEEEVIEETTPVEEQPVLVAENEKETFVNKPTVKPTVVLKETKVDSYILTEEERNRIFDEALFEDESEENNKEPQEDSAASMREKYFKMFHSED